MATLLRKARSTIYPSIDPNTGEQPPPPPPKDTKTFFAKRCDAGNSDRGTQVNLFTAVRSRLSDQFLLHREEEFEKPRSIVQLRRRLVRKASTLSLRAKGLNSSFKVPPNPTRSETFPSRREISETQTATGKTVSSEQTTVIVSAESTTSCTTPSTATNCSAIPPQTANPDFDPSKGPGPARLETPTTVSGSDTRTEQQEKDKFCAGYILRQGIWAKMAAPAVEPPLSYEKLKQITTDACDHALTSVTKYSHAETESWNTTIINTILAALVEATSTESGNVNGASSGPSAPQFKYVVNSTIIQHGVGSTNEDGKASGRRGMHSASGAYWNNEKDGMWSFKYEAAEAKGLDVVIGIVWIWVG